MYCKVPLFPVATTAVHAANAGFPSLLCSRCQIYPGKVEMEGIKDQVAAAVGAIIHRSNTKITNQDSTAEGEREIREKPFLFLHLLSPVQRLIEIV